MFLWLKRYLPQGKGQSKIVFEKYGVNRGWVIVSMLWCRLRYGAKPVDYARFEFYKKNHHECNRYLTIHRFNKMLKEFGYYITREKTYGKIAIYKTIHDNKKIHAC